jgi:putative addiction module component (TIGR02574 family)
MDKSDAVLTAEWLAEIARRSAELDASEVTTVSWETVRDNALQRAGLLNAK